jgi:hypothetical protein
MFASGVERIDTPVTTLAHRRDWIAVNQYDEALQ